MKIAFINTSGLAKDTGPLMREMVYTYYMDMAPYMYLSLSEVYDLIKNIPYKPDPKEFETLQRPYYTLHSNGWGGDCDDKCIALASWAYLHNIPFKFIAARRPDKKTLHHVFCKLYINNKWVNIDPTYSFNTLGRIQYYQELVEI